MTSTQPVSPAVALLMPDGTVVSDVRVKLLFSDVLVTGGDLARLLEVYLTPGPFPARPSDRSMLESGFLGISQSGVHCTPGGASLVSCAYERGVSAAADRKWSLPSPLMILHGDFRLRPRDDVDERPRHLLPMSVGDAATVVGILGPLLTARESAEALLQLPPAPEMSPEFGTVRVSTFTARDKPVCLMVGRSVQRMTRGEAIGVVASINAILGWHAPLAQQDAQGGEP